MSKRYYTLAVFDANGGGYWSPEFGSYDRDDVVYEQGDMYEHGHKLKNMKVICTDADQASIDAAIRQLNCQDRDHGNPS